MIDIIKGSRKHAISCKRRRAAHFPDGRNPSPCFSALVCCSPDFSFRYLVLCPQKKSMSTRLWASPQEAVLVYWRTFSTISRCCRGKHLRNHRIANSRHDHQPSFRPRAQRHVLRQEQGSWGNASTLFPEKATVLDPFLGGGTTAMACLKTGRRFIGGGVVDRICRPRSRAHPRRRGGVEIGA